MSTQFPGFGEEWFEAQIERSEITTRGTVCDVFYPADKSFSTEVPVTEIRLDGFVGIDQVRYEASRSNTRKGNHTAFANDGSEERSDEQ